MAELSHVKTELGFVRDAPEQSALRGISAEPVLWEVHTLDFLQLFSTFLHLKFPHNSLRFDLLDVSAAIGFHRN